MSETEGNRLVTILNTWLHPGNEDDCLESQLQALSLERKNVQHARECVSSDQSGPFYSSCMSHRVTRVGLGHGLQCVRWYICQLGPQNTQRSHRLPWVRQSHVMMTIR